MKIIFPDKKTNKRSGQAMALCLAVIAVLTIIIGPASTFYVVSGRKAKIETADAVSRYLARAAFENVLLFAEDKHNTGEIVPDSDLVLTRRLSTGEFGVGRINKHKRITAREDISDDVGEWLEADSSYYTIYTWGRSNIEERRATQLRVSVMRTEGGWEIIEWDTEVVFIN